MSLDEDAFQDAYLTLAITHDTMEQGAVFEKAFIAAYKKFSGKRICESFTTCHPDELFFSLLPADISEEDAEDTKSLNFESVAKAIKAHIRTNFSKVEVAVLEMRLKGMSVRNTADALGLSRFSIDSTTQRIIAQTRAQFEYAI